MPSFPVKQALEAYKASDSDVARACFPKMNCEERNEYLTATRGLNSVWSD